MTQALSREELEKKIEELHKVTSRRNPEVLQFLRSVIGEGGHVRDFKDFISDYDGAATSQEVFWTKDRCQTIPFSHYFKINSFTRGKIPKQRVHLDIEWNSYFGAELPEDALSLWLKEKDHNLSLQLAEENVFHILLYKKIRGRTTQEALAAPFYIRIGKYYTSDVADLDHRVRFKIDGRPYMSNGNAYYPPAVLFRVDEKLQFVEEPFVSPYWLFCPQIEAYSDEIKKREKIIEANSTETEKIKYLRKGTFVNAQDKLSAQIVRDAMNFCTGFMVPK